MELGETSTLVARAAVNTTYEWIANFLLGVTIFIRNQAEYVSVAIGLIESRRWKIKHRE